MTNGFVLCALCWRSGRGGDAFPWVSLRGEGKGEFFWNLSSQPHPEPWPRLPCSLLHDKGKAVLALKGIVELDQVHMAELVHDGDLVLHILLVEPKGRGVSKKWVRKRSQLPFPRHTHPHPASSFPVLTPAFLNSPPTPASYSSKGPPISQIGNLKPKKEPWRSRRTCCPGCKVTC